jgi:hypothetical protein
MKWLRRVLFALGAVLLAAVALGVLLWVRATREPEFLRSARTVSIDEAQDIVARIEAGPGTSPADRLEPRTGRPAAPYRLALDERQIAALVIAYAPGEFARQVSGLRVRVRERDVVAAGTLRPEPLAGQTAWIAVRPSARGGRLCADLGALHVGDAEVPDRLLRELAGGRPIPRRACTPPRPPLPGPVRGVEIVDGTVVVTGVRR